MGGQWQSAEGPSLRAEMHGWTGRTDPAERMAPRVSPFQRKRIAESDGRAELLPLWPGIQVH